MPRLTPLTRPTLVALLVALTLVPGGSASAKETVALSFGWPSDLKVDVAFTARTTKTIDGQVEDLAMTGRYDVTTSAASEGLLISFDNIQTQVENSESGPQAMVKKYLAKAASAPPSYVVSPNGQFVRVEGLEQFRDNILGGLDEAFGQFPAETRQQLMQTMSAIFTKEQVEAGIMSEWNAAVGTWLDAEMDEGDLYELSYNQPVPAFGNMEVPMRTTFLFKGRRPCNEQDQAQRCVELEMHSFVDPEGLADAVEAFLSRLPAGQVAPQINDLQQETVVRLISEPETLLPHLVETSKRTTTTMTTGDVTKSSSQIEEKRFVYNY